MLKAAQGGEAAGTRRLRHLPGLTLPVRFPPARIRQGRLLPYTAHQYWAELLEQRLFLSTVSFQPPHSGAPAIASIPVAEADLSSAQPADATTTYPPDPDGPALTAVAGNGIVTLTWTAISGDDYSVYRSTTSGEETGPISSGNITYDSSSNTDTFVDDDVSNGTTYYYDFQYEFPIQAVPRSVSAPSFASDGISQEASATPEPLQPPDADGVALAAAGGNGKVTLNWAAVDFSPTFYIYRSTTSGAEEGPEIGSTNNTSYTDTTAVNGTTYYYDFSYELFTIDPTSQEASATPQAPPAAPNLSLTAGDGYVTLNWNAVSGATNYDIYRSTTSGGETSEAYVADYTGGESYTDSKVSNGTTYYYEITAVNNQGTQSALSAENSIKPESPPAAPNLMATAGNGQVTLKWNGVSGATNYDIYRSTTSGGEGNKPLVSGYDASDSYTDSDLNNGTTYYYEITGVDNDGTQSAISNQVSVTPVSPVVAPTVTDIASTATSIVIKGTGFDPNPANNSVNFNDGAAGNVTAASSTSLTVTFSTDPISTGSLTAVVTSDGVSSGSPVQVATVTAPPVTPTVSGNTAGLAVSAASIVINGTGFDANLSSDSITFNDGAVGTVTAASPTSLTVTFSTKPLSPGSLTAVVTIDGVSSGSPVQVATVNPTPSNPTVAGDTLSVTTAAPSIVIEGTGFDANPANDSVAFNDGAVGTVTSASATSLTVIFSTDPISVGSLTAVVTSDGLSSGAPVQVASVAPHATPPSTEPLTILTSSNPSAVGTSITFTATEPNSTRTGNVTFYNGATPIGTAALTTEGVATWSTSSLSVGTHTITVDYSGDANNAAGTAASLTEMIVLPKQIGELDKSFGVGGIASHNVGFTTVSGLAEQQNGKSVIAGTIGSPGSEEFGLTRYNADGSIDTTFGNDGVATVSFQGTNDVPSSATLLPDGEILVAGTSTDESGGQTVGSDFAIALFEADGTLDISFGNGTGKVLTNFSATSSPSTDVANALVLGSGGQFYVAGSSTASGAGTDFAVAAYDADGTADTSFNGVGRKLLAFSGYNTAVANAALAQSNGDLVFAGSATVTSTGVGSIALARLLPDGALDRTFGKKGQIVTSLRGVDDVATSVTLEPQGQILVGGLSATGSFHAGTLTTDFALVRYTSAGKLDTTFGSKGHVITRFVGEDTAITNVLVESNGQIVASGKAAGGFTAAALQQMGIAVARYNANGTLDSSFNTNGQTLIKLASSVTAASERQAAALTRQGEDQLRELFEMFVSNAQGIIATTPGGNLLVAGNSGGNTEVGQLVETGLDLAAALIAKLPASEKVGASAVVTLDVIDAGSTTASATVTVELFLSGSSAPNLGETELYARHYKVNLKSTQGKKYKVTITIPKKLALGKYYLVAEVKPGSLKDLNPANNIAFKGPIKVVKK